MVDFLHLFGDFVIGHIVEFGIIGAIFFGVYYVSRIVKKTPQHPDYIKIFEKKSIIDETMNKPDRIMGLKFLYRGNEYLGRIVTFGKQKHEIKFKDEKGRPEKEEIKDVYTLTYKPKIIGKIHSLTKHIVRFTEDDNFRREEGGKLVFPESINFTSLGNEFVTSNSYEFTSKIIGDNWNKRLFENSANAFSGQMLKVSGFISDYAQARAMEEIEIKKLEAQKKLKMGNII